MASISGLTTGLNAADYMDLLIAQLKHQNPEEPMSNAEMVTQMAQLTTLEEMSKLNLNFKDILEVERLLAGGSLVGKEVEYTHDGATASGEVEAVALQSDGIYVTVDGVEIPSDQISRIL